VLLPLFAPVPPIVIVCAPPVLVVSAICSVVVLFVVAVGPIVIVLLTALSPIFILPPLLPWMFIVGETALPSASVPLDWIVVAPAVAEEPVPIVMFVVPPEVLVLPMLIVCVPVLKAVLPILIVAELLLVPMPITPDVAVWTEIVSLEPFTPPCKTNELVEFVEPTVTPWTAAPVPKVTVRFWAPEPIEIALEPESIVIDGFEELLPIWTALALVLPKLSVGVPAVVVPVSIVTLPAVPDVASPDFIETAPVLPDVVELPERKLRPPEFEVAPLTSPERTVRADELVEPADWSAVKTSGDWRAVPTMPVPDTLKFPVCCEPGLDACSCTPAPEPVKKPQAEAVW
jgi:hypothetical protein